MKYIGGWGPNNPMFLAVYRKHKGMQYTLFASYLSSVYVGISASPLRRIEGIIRLENEIHRKNKK